MITKPNRFLMHQATHAQARYDINDNYKSLDNMAPQKAPPKRGRPVAINPVSRRRLVFDALDAVFAQSGAQGLTMDAVARQAGMSKRTVYALFESREGLLAAYLEEFAQLLVRPVGLDFDSLPLAERLLLLLRPPPMTGSYGLPLAILRILVQVGPDCPSLTQKVLEAGQHRVVALIREELQRASLRQEVTIHDLDAAAELLSDMIRPAPISALLEPQKPSDPAALQARVELAVRVFLNGIGEASP